MIRRNITLKVEVEGLEEWLEKIFRFLYLFRRSILWFSGVFKGLLGENRAINSSNLD